MCSLSDFPAPCIEKNVTLCETDGHLVSASRHIDVSSVVPKMGHYPLIAVTKDTLRPSASKESAKSAFLPHEEPALKRAVTAWNESGFEAAFNILASNPKQELSPFIVTGAHVILSFYQWFCKFYGSIFPHLNLKGESLIASLSRTRDYLHSPVRSLSWHPHSFKLAVALRDDSIKVYTVPTNNNAIIPVLKHALQKGISCMAWRPLSASDLAVGCKTGLVLWHVDPNSVVTRPSGNCVTILTQSGHAPVTSLAWDPDGKFLATACATDTTMYLWDVSMETATPLKRVGGAGVGFLAWSPLSDRLLAATPATIFRIWETQVWVPERWTTVSGKMQCAAWSCCGRYLIFADSDEPFLYSLTFDPVPAFGDKAEEAFAQTVASKMAITIADLTETMAGEERVGGRVLDLCWDAKSERLALIFRDSPLVAIFRTRTKPNLQLLPCGFIRGLPEEVPNIICFQNEFNEGAQLTIAWSSGRIQYVPLMFMSQQSSLTSLTNVTLDPRLFSSRFPTSPVLFSP